MTATGKDLTKEAPTSPSQRVGGYVILARVADKGRAMFMGGNAGEYHTDCPLDHMLLDFKGVPYADVKQQLESGASDEEIAEYLDSHGTPKTPAEVEAWSDSMDEMNPYNNPEKKEWFAGVCAELGLDPAKTTLFEWLDADDKASFPK
jgi:hypothetical protein